MQHSRSSFISIHQSIIQTSKNWEHSRSSFISIHQSIIQTSKNRQRVHSPICVTLLAGGAAFTSFTTACTTALLPAIPANKGFCVCDACTPLDLAVVCGGGEGALGQGAWASGGDAAAERNKLATEPPCMQKPMNFERHVSTERRERQQDVYS
jgi:hypothetical protein